MWKMLAWFVKISVSQIVLSTEVYKVYLYA